MCVCEVCLLLEKFISWCFMWLKCAHHQRSILCLCSSIIIDMAKSNYHARLAGRQRLWLIKSSFKYITPHCVQTEAVSSITLQTETSWVHFIFFPCSCLSYFIWKKRPLFGNTMSSKNILDMTVLNTESCHPKSVGTILLLHPTRS